ncbi:hypothetical protein B6I21_07110, partial [candidate division KSB1 bacterium 4572_119]
MIFVSLILFMIIYAFASSAETDREYGLVIPQVVLDYWETHKVDVQSFSSGDLQASIDWSANDSDVKNQSSCGSCWAFAAVALVENISNENDVSEQVVISCVEEGSCSGGWYGDALKYTHDSGIPPEVCYVYTATNGNCGNKCSDPEYGLFVTNYDYYGRWGVPNSSTINSLKNLLQTGPVCVSMYVPADTTFDRYDGGIYNYEGGPISEDRGHAILVVGYDDSEEYFKAKNSWGGSWGESGYFRISYDDVTDDVQFGGYACTASGAYVTYYVPVELVSFTVDVNQNSVLLNWHTLSETDNYGFAIERSGNGTDYQSINFVKGVGTTSVPQSYSAIDENLPVGRLFYRLKQIDFDGQFNLSNVVEVKIQSPKKHALVQNYPNPFNSETKISFQLPGFEFVSLKIYNIVGKEVKTLYERKLDAGYHAVVWNGKNAYNENVPSGIYFCQLKSGDFETTRRMLY